MEPLVVIASVDAAYGQVIEEALAEAGIVATLAPVMALQQFQIQQGRARPMVEVQVPRDREIEARTVLAELEDASSAAATEQAEQASPEDIKEARDALGADLGFWLRLMAVIVVPLSSLWSGAKGKAATVATLGQLLGAALVGVSFTVGGPDNWESPMTLMICGILIFAVSRIVDGAVAAFAMWDARTQARLEETDGARS